MTIEQPIWQPDPSHVETTLMHRFAVRASGLCGRKFNDYESLWRWSIDDRESFWSLVWEFCGLRGARGDRVLIDGHLMPGARWFPDARLNLAENLLDRGPTPDSPAVIFWGEDKIRREISQRELRAGVASMAAALRAQGVKAGDRVAAFMPNMPEALVAMLAAASIGAVFTSTSPDFGVQGVIDRFGQTQPRVLFAVDGYWYNGKGIDCMPKLREIVARLPSIEAVVLTRYLNADTCASGIDRGRSYEDFVAPYTAVSEIEFSPLPFDHPLYILYSSGTTGIPKAIIHGAGGTLLQHVKEQLLHDPWLDNVEHPHVRPRLRRDDTDV
jgi:acetoacetyl-CoA synthetase